MPTASSAATIRQELERRIEERRNYLANVERVTQELAALEDAHRQVAAIEATIDALGALATLPGTPRRRGRPPGSKTGRRRGRPPKTGMAAAAESGRKRGRKPGRPKGTGRRRGRPRKQAAGEWA
jgi:hypothetical protein